MKLKPIDQQVVVVVGASSGIGRDTAMEFARRGARVVVSARNDEGLNSLVEEIRSEGGEATSLSADVAQFEQMEKLAEHAVSSFGRIDTWVHLAAVSVYATFESTTPEEFRQVIEVDLIGQAYGAKAALPYLRQAGGGALIHVSSVEALRSMPFHSAYAAAKHGVAGLLDAMRLELQREGVPISVTNVMPASINTPFFNKARTKLGVEPKGLPPIYEPRVVTEAILFAAEHPRRDLFAGGAARMIAFSQALSPRLTDALLLRTAFKGQLTHKPKAESAPDSLFEPIAGYNQIKGDFDAEARSTALYPKLQMQPWLLAAGLAVGVTAWAAARGMRSNGHRA